MNTEVTALEGQMADLKAMQERRDAALRLSNNADFRKLILNFFCRDECARYAQASADPSLSAEDRANALALAQAAGHVRRFLSVQMQMGNNADGSILELEEMIAQARAEEDASE